MKKFLQLITNNNIGALKKPVMLEIVQSILQGQPYFIILLVVLAMLAPLMNPGSTVDIGYLVRLSLSLAAIMLILFIVGKYTYTAEYSIAYSISSEGRLNLGEYLRKLPMGFFKGRDPGDVTALMLQDYTNIETMLSHLLMDAVGAVTLPLVFIIFLFPIDWRMSLVTVSMVPFALAIAFVTRLLVTRLGKRQIKVKTAASSRMLEYLDGMRNIKSYNLQGRKFTRLEKTFRKLKDESIILESASGPAVILGFLFLNAGIALIMISGIYFVIEGTLSIPYFLFFLVVGTRMYDPLSKVLVNFAELSYYSLSASRISEIYDTKPLPEPEISAGAGGHDIEFENVWFHYHETDVLKNVSFRLEENTMTALVGPSGSGKTTITRLIARFWDVNSGEIRIGGSSVKKFKTGDLMERISMVFQDVYLFNDTVLNNIRVGKSDATIEEVVAAAEEARCHEFISRLPDGYNTMVGEAGSTLSGGEKQRVSIARAILKNAPIVLLDEATASLDPENELYIQEAIGELVKKRTLIVIAHRLSTVTRADQILVINKGELVECGTHDELLAIDDSFYSGMWNEQKRAHQWKLKTVV
jgi:ATP-binding cassette subfamily B protein